LKFSEFNNLNPNIKKALEQAAYTHATPVQEASYTPIRSGKDLVGIAQTGTGKTLAYLLPLLNGLPYKPYDKQQDPRALILVPTRELVKQVVAELDKFTEFTKNKVLGIYGGTNINTQKKALDEGVDIVVATPGRLYDLALSRAISLKRTSKIIIDEVDEMLDLGFKYQIENILDLLPVRRQGILFSATLSDKIEAIIDAHFIKPTKISVALSGTPLENIEQKRIEAPNFYSKLHAIAHFLEGRETYTKNLVFVANKKHADIVFEYLEEQFPNECTVIHSNKTQNYRFQSIEAFDNGEKRILIATDVLARGLDISDISHVLVMDPPKYPENYIHRIGRTGRANKKGKSVLFSTPKEQNYLEAIEALMQFKIPAQDWPTEVALCPTLLPEEKPKPKEIDTTRNKKMPPEKGAAFHEKSEKNKKTNQGGSYRRKLAAKYKKPKTRGDKNLNRKRNKKK